MAGFICVHSIELFCFTRKRTGLLSVSAGIGKNVISEQAATLTDACTMVTAARYYPQLMSIMNNALRFLPAFILMKRLLAEGYCGTLQVNAHLHTCLGVCTVVYSKYKKSAHPWFFFFWINHFQIFNVMQQLKKNNTQTI